jgi:hypothetical protein
MRGKVVLATTQRPGSNTKLFGTPRQWGEGWIKKDWVCTSSA